MESEYQEKMKSLQFKSEERAKAIYEEKIQFDILKREKELKIHYKNKLDI